LILGARRRDRLEATVEACRRAGAESVMAVALDVTDRSVIAGCFSEIASTLGGLDVLVNNAGTAMTKAAMDYSPGEFDQIMSTNLDGAILCSREAYRLMAPQGDGDIVNVASILGLRVAGGVGPYAVSKAALIEATRSQAVEWATAGVRVNALAPGYIETELNTEFFASDAGKQLIARVPMQRLGSLDDLDAPLLFLVSGASKYLTGCVLTVDGAHHLNER
jgi:NAD(P)-dependent dehydrogenase (short-subunit alcohol dehydrogenase family)